MDNLCSCQVQCGKQDMSEEPGLGRRPLQMCTSAWRHLLIRLWYVVLLPTFDPGRDVNPMTMWQEYFNLCSYSYHNLGIGSIVKTRCNKQSLKNTSRLYRTRMRGHEAVTGSGALCQRPCMLGMLQVMQSASERAMSICSWSFQEIPHTVLIPHWDDAWVRTRWGTRYSIRRLGWTWALWTHDVRGASSYAAGTWALLGCFQKWLVLLVPDRWLSSASKEWRTKCHCHNNDNWNLSILRRILFLLHEFCPSDDQLQSCQFQCVTAGRS